MAATPNVRLSLPGRPENVLVVRQALSGLARYLALDAIETNDLNTAVTEACNNVVMHAYDGDEGPLEVEVQIDADALAVVVRDRGVGIDAHERESLASDGGEAGPGGGMGLAVIDALARAVEFTVPAGGGTEVRMCFPAPARVTLPAVADAAGELEAQVLPQAASAVELCVVPGALAPAVLPRVLSALAVRAHFTTDRISDVQIVADVLASNAGDSLPGDTLAVGVSVAPRSLELRIGPLETGRGESLMAAAADGLAPVVERLTDSTRVAVGDAGETLELRLIDQR
ncbi:MAG TPA: ATP-binding protein [Solirubrobacteraceae bacterium]|nr:ATP-binding protein [Solirubrobacteraceae bacterium]